MKSNKTEGCKKQFKVVKILSDESIAINGGKINGISVNDKFKILGKEIQISDPNSGENLGTVQDIKNILTVTTVLEKACICSHIVNGGVSRIQEMVSDLYTYDVKKKLNVDEQDLPEETLDDKIIRIGDIAELVSPEEIKTKSTGN